MEKSAYYFNVQSLHYLNHLLYIGDHLYNTTKKFLNHYNLSVNTSFDVVNNHASIRLNFIETTCHLFLPSIYHELSNSLH